MLKKMLIHGMIAAAVNCCAAAVYATGRTDGDTTDNAVPTIRVEADTRMDGNNGYIADDNGYRERNRDFRQESEHGREHEYAGDGSKHHRKHGERNDD